MTTVSNRVTARDDFGRFLADLEGAAQRTASQTLDVGIQASRSVAPEKTGRLKRGFIKTMLSSHSGIYSNPVFYAGFQDQGTSPRAMNAWVSFYWEKMGRNWMNPALYKRVTGYEGNDPIQHPGNPATFFMQAGWVAMQRRASAIMHRNYG